MGQRRPNPSISPSKKSPQNKGANFPRIQNDNPVEAIRNVTSNLSQSLKDDLLAGGARDFGSQFSQLFGFEKPKMNASGDITSRGLEIDSLTPERQQEEQWKARYTQERRMHEEDQTQSQKRTEELRVELEAIMQEVQHLAKSTVELSREVKIAAVQKPVNPGKYHVIFFKSLLEFIASFREKIDNSSLWLAEQNKRSQKKGMFWGQVAKSGAKRLLSQEDYSVSRSVG